MLRRQQHHIALGVQWLGAIVLTETVQRVEDRDIEFIGIELRRERLGRAVPHRGVDAGRILLEGREQAVETHRSDSRHHAKADRHLVEQPEILGDRLGGLRLLQNLTQMWLHPPPELGERDLPPFAMEQRTAELRLELLDRRGEGRLRNMASLGGSREAQRLCRRKEIPHLVHFHERLPDRDRHVAL